MAYKGKYQVKNLGKYLGNPNITFRSLWELSTFKWIENNDNIVKWASEVEIKYLNDLDGKVHRYYVDLYLQYKDGTIKLIEIKPDHQTRIPKEPKKKTKRYVESCQTYITNTSKWRAAQKICDQNGYKFEIWTEHTLKQLGIKIIT